MSLQHMYLMVSYSSPLQHRSPSHGPTDRKTKQYKTYHWHITTCTCSTGFSYRMSYFWRDRFTILRLCQRLTTFFSHRWLCDAMRHDEISKRMLHRIPYIANHNSQRGHRGRRLLYWRMSSERNKQTRKH